MVHLRALQWGFICHASKILVGSRSNSGMRSARSGFPISSSTAWHRGVAGLLWPASTISMIRWGEVSGMVSKQEFITTFLRQTEIPVAPSMERALRYFGVSRWVAFHRSRKLNSLCWADGRSNTCRSASSVWDRFLSHPFVAPYLQLARPGMSGIDTLDFEAKDDDPDLFPTLPNGEIFNYPLSRITPCLLNIRGNWRMPSYWICTYGCGTPSGTVRRGRDDRIIAAPSGCQYYSELGRFPTPYRRRNPAPRIRED